MTTKFYDSSNPYTKEVLAKLGKNPAVQAELRRFGASGFVLSPTSSFVIEGDNRTGRHLEMAVLSLGNPAVPQDAIYLFCVGGAAATEIGSVRLTLDPTVSRKDGYEKISDGVWMALVESPASLVDSNPRPQNSWNWKRWLKCLGDGVANGASQCTIVCSWIPYPPGYWKCVVVCTAVRTAATLIGCSIAEL
jgi:hypothetical protein